MIFARYDEQRSFPEYVDMTFKDLVFSKEYNGKGLPMYDWADLLEFIKDGYFPDFGDIPEYLVDEGLEYVSHRRLKKLCKKLFDEYGEKEKSQKLHDDFDTALAKMENNYVETD